MSRSSLPAVTSDIPRDLRLFLDRVREAVEGAATRRDVAQVISRVVKRRPDDRDDDDWDDDDWDDWFEGIDWWDEGDLPPDIDKLLDLLAQRISESDIAKYLAERIDLIQIPDTRLKALNAALDAKVEALNAELTATIRELADGGTDITIGGESGYTSIRALKVSNSLNSAAIAQINNVSEDSGSFTARTLYGVHAAIYDGETGLAQSHARITREELVRASADEALASRIDEIGVELTLETDKLEGWIRDERTARADADGVLVRDLTTLTGRVNANEGQISDLNEVTVTSNSVNARQTAQLTATVNDPTTGLARAHAEIASIRTAYASADQALAQQISGLTATVGAQGATVRQLDQALVGYCSRSGYSSRDTCVAAGGTWHILPFAEAVRQVSVSSGGNTLTIESLMRATVGADGTARGLYGIKIDHGGYVSGFGLSSQVINGQPVSHFVVNADYFAIGSPARGGTSTAQYPFMVATSPTVVNGESVPAGVYMRDAFIRNGAITSAKIADAAIQSAKIATAAITAAHIQDATILAAKIRDGEITNAKIADGAITSAKIGTATITSANIADGAITSAKIGSAAITSAQIQSLSADKITAGALSISSAIQSANYSPGSRGWQIHGNGSVEFILAGTQFKILDDSSGQITTPFRVAGGVVYIDRLQVQQGNIPSGLITGASGSWSSSSAPWPADVPMQAPGNLIVIVTVNAYTRANGQQSTLWVTPNMGVRYGGVSQQGPSAGQTLPANHDGNVCVAHMFNVPAAGNYGASAAVSLTGTGHYIGAITISAIWAIR